MFSYIDLQEKEKRQSHSFIFFHNGIPYYELGWASYKTFNEKINNFLHEFKSSHGVVVYLYEHELIFIENFFLWGFSFFEENPEKREKLTSHLKHGIYEIMKLFPELKDRKIFNNHENDFQLSPDLAMHYTELVMGAEHLLEHTYSPPKEKSYTKELIDLNEFKVQMTTCDFIKKVTDNLNLSSGGDLAFMFAPDGYHSNKYRENKYLREEFVPIMKYLKYKSIPDDSMIHLGMETENYDAKITNITNNQEIVLEITSGAPKNDHLLLSLINQSNGIFPLKTKAKLKSEFDSLPSRIIKSINDKHNKKYQDKRTLLVTVPTEYTYQGEDYVLEEIIKEVRASVNMGKGNFTEIIMLCDSRFHAIF